MAENTPQFYTVVPEPVRYGAPAQGPIGGGSKISKKTWRIALAVVVILVLSVLGWRVYKNRLLAIRDAVEAQVQEKSTSCAVDDAQCVERARIAAASEAGLVQACDGLSAGSFTRCVKRISVDQANPDVCKVLAKGPERDNCIDFALLAKLQKDGATTDACAKIVTPAARNSCNNAVEERAVRELACEKYDIDESKCETEKKIRALLDAQDLKGCAQLAGASDVCTDRFVAEDRDGDGLSRFEEVDLGTSDDNPDTDGDGYSDLLETNSGYNPVKPN